MTPSEQSGSSGTQRIDRFHLLLELGRGGQGVVWLARDERSGERVALKVLTHVGPGCERALQRFSREAAVVERFDHPGICPVIDTGVHDDVPWIAMKYVEGTSLERRIRATGHSAPLTTLVNASGGGQGTIAEQSDRTLALPRHEAASEVDIDEITSIFEQAASALHAAHEQGVIHRDVKPSNIMVTPDGQPVLLDFGLAKELEAEGPTFTMSDELFGTPSYMAPELLKGRSMVSDRRSDIWSLGVALYEMTTGERPFAGPTREALYRAILKVEPQPPRQLNPKISRKLEVVIETALSKELDKRYQTAGDLADDLRRVRAGEAILAKSPGPFSRAARWVKRRPAAAALILVLAISVPALTWLGGYLIAQLPALEEARVAKERERLDALLAAAWFEWSEGSQEKGLAFFRSALASAPDDAEAVAGVALGLYGLKRYEEALVHIERHAHVERSHPSLIPIHADVLQFLDRKDEAKELRETLPKMESAVDLYISGIRHIDRGHSGRVGAYEIAYKNLRRAILMSDRVHPNHYYQLAHAIGHVTAPDASHDIAAILSRRWPERATAAYWAGFALMPVSASAAEPHMLRARDLGSVSRTLYSNLGIIFTRQKRYAEGLEAYTKALEIRPDKSTVVRGAAACEIGLGREDDAERRLLAFADIQPEDWRAIEMISDIRKGREDWEGQREILQRGVANIASKTLLFALGYVEIAHLNDPRSAAKRFRKILGTFPDHAAARANLGRCYELVGDIPMAIKQWRRATRDDPKLIPASSNLCRVYVARGELDAALDERERFVAAAPEQASGWRYLAEHHLDHHDQQDRASLTEGLAAARRAHGISKGSDLEGRALIARCLLAMDRPDDAVQVLEAATERILEEKLSGASVLTIRRLLREARERR